MNRLFKQTTTFKKPSSLFSPLGFTKPLKPLTFSFLGLPQTLQQIRTFLPRMDTPSTKKVKKIVVRVQRSKKDPLAKKKIVRRKKYKFKPKPDQEYSRSFMEISNPRNDTLRRIIKNAPFILIDEEGNRLGNTYLKDAQRIAKAQKLDLVLMARSPVFVCRLMTKDQLLKKSFMPDLDGPPPEGCRDKVKEIQVSDRITEFDLNRKVNKAKELLADRYRVRFFIKFRDLREYSESVGRAVLNNMISRVEDAGNPSGRIQGDGLRDMFCLVNPDLSKIEVLAQAAKERYEKELKEYNEIMEKQKAEVDSKRQMKEQKRAAKKKNPRFAREEEL
eukprot:TRINITY_DN8819_c0_g1_i1.p1 TRINITY_DN8819_c0_g1~~TRINITY_DN8819_c0_g1_i1.p1  ORF type:complete len:332 (-),score=60.23 TRINITY_DN8819_c0_g1_i1:140-1135(-)